MYDLPKEEPDLLLIFFGKCSGLYVCSIKLRAIKINMFIRYKV